jgi:hypothetical protein
VAPGVPVPDEQGDVAVRIIERDRHHGAVVDSDGAIPASSALQTEGWEVEEAANLVLELELVGPVPARRNRAVSAGNAILPGVHSHLDAVPILQKELMKLAPMLLQFEKLDSSKATLVY